MVAARVLLGYVALAQIATHRRRIALVEWTEAAAPAGVQLERRERPSPPAEMYGM